MSARKVTIPSSGTSRRGRPALTPEARENQMIALAMDLVEERLRNGTASSQETTHFLKLASSKEQLEKDKLRKEIEEKDAKIKSMESSNRTEELYENAVNAFKSYRSSSDDNNNGGHP